MYTGLQISGVGDMTVRFRPALIFQPKHANMFLEGFEKALKDHQMKSLQISNLTVYWNRL